MVCLHSSSYFQDLQSRYQLFGDCTKNMNSNGITVTFMFHSFFISLERSQYLSFFSLSFNFTLLSAGTAKCTIQQVLLLFFF